MSVKYFRTDGLNPLQKEYRNILFGAADRIKNDGDLKQMLKTINIMLEDLKLVQSKLFN